MLKLILAMMCAPLIGTAAADGNKHLVCYWFLVMMYWIMNYVEGKR